MDIRVGISLPNKAEVERMLDALAKGGFNIKINDKPIKDTIKDIKAQMESISKETDIFKYNVHGAKTLQKNIQVVTDEYGRLVETVRVFDEEGKKVVATTERIVNNVEKQQKAYQKLATDKQIAQDRINKLYDGGNIDIEKLEKLQTHLDRINTDNATNEFKLLNKTISEAEKQDVNIQKQIDNKIKAEQSYTDWWLKALKQRELAQEQADAKAVASLEKIQSQMQGKLNKVSDNELVNNSVIVELQNKLNSITTDTSEKEINELKNAITNLASSDSKIVRLQNAISSIGDKLEKSMKLDGDFIDDNSLRKMEEELLHLQSLMGRLKSGEFIDSAKITSSINTANSSFRKFATNVDMAKKSTTTFSEKLKHALQVVGLYSSTSRILGATWREFKSGVEYIVRLDSAMTNLKKVTNETNETYSKFLNSMHETAMELGTQSDKMVEAVTSWAKTGKSLAEASELAKNTIILANVGDLDSVDMAQQHMLPALQAFNMEAERSIELIDKYNNVSNNMATDVSDIGEGISKSASSMAVAGNTLEETIALLATAESATKLGGNEIGNA